MVTHTRHLGRLGSVWRHRLCLQTPSQWNNRCILHQNKSLDPLRNRALIRRSLGMSSSGYPKPPVCYCKCVQCTK